ncbi:amiloride-sensitive sodium channel subunit alpha-like [Amblyraja radiata]|uniref:amiloride-sensitive sodium channel subunit alpha-like n=1 Tax=Amblyraja radiata TaxID=386614 RepID=UPI0014041EAF|nr:amiloride-sensitive sodium channel subunit alpha-like [Amblyraja radiata]
MVTKCGCAHYLYPLPDGAEYCDYRRHTAWGHCYYRLYKEYTDNVLGCFKICRKPCQQTEYSVVAGYGKWPSGNSKDWTYRILDQENGKIKSNRKTVAKLNIYYRELNYKTTSETPAFPAEVMLSALGGQLGLFFGCSVLSLAEILELLVDLTTVTLLVVLGRCLGTRAPDPA